MNLLDKLDNHLYWNIMDFTEGNPRNNYKNVMIELEHATKVRCGKTCRYVLGFMEDGTILPAPMLIKTTHAICTSCDTYPLSEYHHRYCDKCAKKGSYEYNYHHRFCRGFDHDRHPITDPL